MVTTLGSLICPAKRFARSRSPSSVCWFVFGIHVEITRLADPRSNTLEFVQAKPSTDGTQPGIYAVEHTAPGFLGSLALCVTEGSVSQPLMNVYDGCHVTIQVPVDFGNEKEKELRQIFDQELPGVWLTVHGRASVTKPRISELSIDEFAYVRGAKAAEEWKNVAEKAELKNDAFPVVDWAASRTLRQFLQGHK